MGFATVDTFTEPHPISFLAVKISYEKKGRSCHAVKVFDSLGEGLGKTIVGRLHRPPNLRNLLGAYGKVVAQCS
ncbi:MAG: hypothetical protein QW220_04895, partial [Candidatus Bathyarchaeia archaeon]